VPTLFLWKFRFASALVDAAHDFIVIISDGICGQPSEAVGAKYVALGALRQIVSSRITKAAATF
jgi:hypothetical protein